MRPVRNLALIGSAVLAELPSIAPARAAMNHNETFLRDID
jgi:hypothetical protein